MGLENIFYNRILSVKQCLVWKCRIMGCFCQCTVSRSTAENHVMLVLSEDNAGSTDVCRNVCKVNLHSSLTKVDSVCPLLYKCTRVLHSTHLSTWQVFKYEFNSNELTWKHCWKCYYKHHFLKSESVFAHGSTCACEQSRWFTVRLSVWTV